MHSMDRSAMLIGIEQDSNASASFLAFNDHKFTSRLLEEPSHDQIGDRNPEQRQEMEV